MLSSSIQLYDCIKLSLWEDHVGSLQSQTTYLFSNVRVKSFRGRKYLNTPKETDLFAAVVTSAFDENLAEVRCDELQNISQVSGNIIGIQKVSKLSSCMNCKKRVEVGDEKPFVTCGNCSLSFKPHACISSWYVKLIFKPLEEAGLLKLEVFNHVVAKICKSIDQRFSPQTCTDQKIIDTFLKSNVLTILYDKEDCRINDVM